MVQRIPSLMVLSARTVARYIIVKQIYPPLTVCCSHIAEYPDRYADLELQPQDIVTLISLHGCLDGIDIMRRKGLCERVLGYIM